MSLTTGRDQMLKDLSDAELMLAVGKGDLGAFNETVRRHQHTAWRVAYRFLDDPVEAEDITQEAFLRILTAAPRYKPTAAFSTYLYRVITRLCIDQVRKKRPIIVDSFPGLIDPAPDPAAALAVKERDALIRRALDALPSRQRMAVILKYYEGLRYAEIGSAMNISDKAVERLLSRARKILRSSLAHLKK